MILPSYIKGEISMKRIIAIILITTLCLAATGCTITKKEGPADKDATFSVADETKSADASENSAATAETSGADKGDKPYASIQDYISDPEISQSIDSARESMGDKITFEYHAEGDMLFYDYTYTDQYDESAVATLKPVLETSLENNIDSFREVVDVIRKNVNVANPKLVVTYHNNDGTVIATRTFD